jgi:hypothetical protein
LNSARRRSRVAIPMISVAARTHLPAFRALSPIPRP